MYINRVLLSPSGAFQNQVSQYILSLVLKMLLLSLLSLSLAFAVRAQDGNSDYGPDTCINGKVFISSLFVWLVQAHSY